MARPPAGLDPRIARLPTTTFFGRRLRRRQIADIQEIVASLPRLSRTELGHTVCEYLCWQTPRGSNRIQLAMRLLEAFERLSILTLPARQGPGRGPQKPLVPGARSAPRAPVDGPLPRLAPLRLRLVADRAEAGLWNEFPRPLPSAGLPPADRLSPALLPPRPGRAPAGLPAVRLRRPLPAGARPLDRLAGPAAPAAGARRAPGPLPFVSLGAREVVGVTGPGAEPAPAGRGLAARPRGAARARRDLCRPAAQGDMLPGLKLALPGTDPGARCLGRGAGQDPQGGLRLSPAEGLADGPDRAATPFSLPLNAPHPQACPTSAQPAPCARLLNAYLPTAMQYWVSTTNFFFSQSFF